MIEETKYYKVIDGRLITDNFSLLIKDINSISFYQPLFTKVFSIFFGTLSILSSFFFIFGIFEERTLSSIGFFFIVSTILILVTLYFSLFRRLTIESEHGKYSILSLSKAKRKSMKVLKDSLKF